MLHTKFCGNLSTGSREEDFLRVFTIYGCGSHFGHVTSIMSLNFHFLEPESLHIKFGFDWPSGFWEKPVLSFICNWLWVKVKKWPWPSILIYLHNFMLFQVTGCKSSEKSTVFTFSYRKALPNLTLSQNRSRSTQDHHLNKIWWAGVIDATYQVSWKSVHRFQRRRFLKGFYHIWAWQPAWSCDQH